MSNNDKYRIIGYSMIPAGKPISYNDNEPSISAIEAGDRLLRKRLSYTQFRPPLQQLDESYTSRGIYRNLIDSQEVYDRARADSQSALEQLRNFAVQTVGNEILLGMGLGLSNLVDFGINLFKGEGEDDYTNPVSTYIENLQEDIRKEFEIYRKNPNDHFAVNDFGWWADNMVSVGSTLSLMLPAMGVTKTLSTIGKIGNASRRASVGLAKLSKLNKFNKGKYYTTGELKGLASRVKSIEEGTKITTNALLSRTMENYQEGRGVYNLTYANSLDRLNEFTDEERKEFIRINPEFKDKDNKQIAAIIAQRSADRTFRNDYAMLLFDMAQFKGIIGLKKIGVGNKNTFTNAKLRIENRNAAKKLLGTSEKELEKTGFISRQKEQFRYLMQNPWEATYNTAVGLELSEGVEEAYQGIQTEKGKEVAEKVFNKSFNERDIISYLSDPEIYEQAVWGIIGAKAFQWAGKQVNKAENYIKHKNIKDKLKEDNDINFLLSTDERIKTSEINNRQQLAQTFKDNLTLIDNGKNPYAKFINEEGKTDYEDLNADEKDLAKAQVINDYVTEITLNAADAGNYDLLKEYLSSSEFDKFINQRDGAENNDKILSKMLLDKMDEVYDLYASAATDIMDNVDNLDNDYIIKLQARDITRNRLLQNAIQDKIDGINIELNKNGYSDSYYRQQLRKSAKDEIENLISIKSKLQKHLDDNKISKSYYNKEIELIDKKIDDILLTLGYYSGSIGDNLQKINDYLNESNISDSDVNNLELIKSKVNLQIEKVKLYSENPLTKKEYNDQYKEIAERVDKLAEKKFEDSLNTVTDWLEKQEDLDIAKNDIYQETNILPKEVKEALSVLKLGSPNTIAYKFELDNHINDLKNKRGKKEEKDRTNRANGVIDNTNTNTNDVIDNTEKENVNNAQKKEPKKNRTLREKKQNDAHNNKVKNTILDKLRNSTSNKDLQYHLNELDKLINNENVTLSKTEKDFVDRIRKNLNSAPQIIAEEEQTETVDNNIPPSTGKQTEVKIEDTVITEEEEIPKEVEDIAAELQGEESIINDNYDQETVNRIDRLVRDYIIQLYKNEKSIIYDKDFDDKNKNPYLSLLTDIKRMLQHEQVPDNYINRHSKNAIKSSLHLLYMNNRNKHNSFVDNLRKLYPEFKSSGFIINFNSILKEDIDVYIEEINNLFKEYLQQEQFLENTKIDINSFFEYLIYNEKLSNTELSNLFNILLNVKDNIDVKLINAKNLELYKENPEMFFQMVKAAKTRKEVIASNFHMNLHRGSDYLQRSKLGDKFVITRNGNSLEARLKETGELVGYISTVKRSKDNAKVKLNSQNKTNFVYTVWEENGQYYSNTDEFFKALLSDPELYNFFREEAFNLNATDPKHKEIKKNLLIILKNHGLILEGDDKNFNISEEDKNKKETDVIPNIIRTINRILFFNKADISLKKRYNSYKDWIKNVYINYNQTAEIQDLLSNNQNIELTLSAVPGILAYYKENKNVSDSGLTAENNPILAVSDKGDIITESLNINGYSNAANFKSGTMGMLIQDNPDAPLIALFKEANKLNDSDTELKNAVKAELIKLLKDYQNGKLEFDELYKNLSELISNNKDNLFRGIHIIKHESVLYLNIGNKNKYIAKIFSKFENKDNRNIYHFANGDLKNRTGIIENNNNDVAIENLVNDILDNLSFNKTFYFINNKSSNNTNDKKYFRKKNGKIHINIGGYNFVYNSFGEFVIKNNAFKTNTYKTENNDTFFEKLDEKSSSIYMTINRESPVEGLVDSKSISDYVETGSYGEEEKVTELALNKLGKTNNFISKLLGTNEEYPIPLLPQVFSYDEKLPTNASYNLKTGKITIGSRGLKYIKQKPELFIQFLMHEQFHKYFNETNLRNRNKVISGLLETYNEFVEYVKNDNSEEGNYWKNWISKFNFDTYFNNDVYKNQNLTEEEKALIFVEEWLVESFSRNRLTEYLNNAILKGKSIIVDNIEEQNKSIWQKIIDLVLKLFGISNKNIKNNTILAKQYLLLSNEINANDNVQSETQTNIKENNVTQNKTNKISNKKERKPNIRRNSILSEDTFDIINFNKQLNQIKEKAIANGTFMKAPNGKPTNLNERQWLHVRTKEFKNWFGDWENNPENASKVIDENGEPLVQYHQSTAEDFNEFNLNKSNKDRDALTSYSFHFGTKSAAQQVEINGKRGKLFEAFLNIKNPVELLDNIQASAYQTLTNFCAYFAEKRYGKVLSKKLFDKARSIITDYYKNPEEKRIIMNEVFKYMNFDGVKYKNEIEDVGSISYAVLNSNQIKSASNNIGSYSENNDIRYSVLEETNDVNSVGVTIVPNMDKYLDGFNQRDRVAIRKNIETGMISFKCQ